MDNWDLDGSLIENLISEGTALIRDLTNVVTQYLAPIAMICDTIFDVVSSTSPSFENWLAMVETFPPHEKLTVYSSVHTITETFYGGVSPIETWTIVGSCLLYTSPSPRD